MSSNGKLYSIFKRNRIYYAQFKLPDRRWSTAKSTGKTSRSEAERWCFDYLCKGNIVLKENVTLEEFSRDFFSWGGEWATDKLVSGKHITPRQCKEKTAVLNNRIIPALGKMYLASIDKGVIKSFRNDLYQKGLAGQTINITLSCLKVILEAAEEKSLISGSSNNYMCI